MPAQGGVTPALGAAASLAAPAPAASTEALRAHLARTKMVEVADADGSRWRFMIRHVPLLTWDESNSWFSDTRAKSPDQFCEKVASAIKCPSLATMRRVLLRGVAQPSLADTEVGAGDRGGSGIPVDDLLARDVLAVGLYGEITAFSCGDLFEIRQRGPGDARAGTPT